MCWYVDDDNISHVHPNVADSVIEMIGGKFVKIIKRRGKKHTFIGMDIELIDNGRVKILMKEYLEESIGSFGEDMGKKANIPAKGGLFKTDETSKDLNEDNSEIFYHIASKLLFVTKRARLDI